MSVFMRTSTAAAAAVVLVTAALLMTEARLFTPRCKKNSPDTSDILCALNAPDVQVDPQQGMTGHIGCTMSCTLDEKCQHFNYVAAAAAAAESCQLFYSRPNMFSIVIGCQHYQSTDTAADADACVPILVQQHVDNSSFFNRSWNEFKAGFRDTSSGNFWLGNEKLHQLTKDGNYRLRVDLQALNDSRWYWVEYSTIIVYNESTNYTLEVDGFMGGTAADVLVGSDRPTRQTHNGMQLTTYDRDNDENEMNCAIKRGGGFWYKTCGPCRINDAGRSFSWSKISLPGWHGYLKTSQVWLKACPDTV